MKSQRIFPSAAYLPMARDRLAPGMLLLLMISVPAWAQAGTDSLERSFHFVEKSAEGTELFNTNRPQEALAIFRELATSYSDLDEDGYVALSIGDCLAAMGQFEESRRAYEALASVRPDLQHALTDRLTDAELLSGVISEELLVRLRSGQGASEADAVKRRIRLGWALEKKAYGLLLEAVEVFRSTSQPAWFRGDGGSNRHALLLEEISRDLAGLVAQTDALFGSRSIPRCDDEVKEAEPAFQLERRREESFLRTQDGKRFELQLRRESGDCEDGVQVNGRPLELTEDEKRIIQRHRDRIHEILIQAANRTANR